MKTVVKMVVAAVLAGGLVFGAMGQIVMDQYGTITVRTHNDPYHYTYHYGDLQVRGGVSGTGWGWLTAERLYVNGNSQLSGDLNVYGSKNFIHPHPTDESKVIRYVAIESGEALTLARGIAKTVNGEAVVPLPEHFSLVTSKNVPVAVTLTPEGAPVVLYTKQKSKDKIVVAMKKSDLETFNDVEFAFQVTGVRDGFEKQEVIIDEAKFNSPTYKSEWVDTEVGKRINARAVKADAKRDEKYQKVD